MIFSRICRIILSLITDHGKVSCRIECLLIWNLDGTYTLGYVLAPTIYTLCIHTGICIFITVRILPTANTIYSWQRTTPSKYTPIICTWVVIITLRITITTVFNPIMRTRIIHTVVISTSIMVITITIVNATTLNPLGCYALIFIKITLPDSTGILIIALPISPLLSLLGRAPGITSIRIDVLRCPTTISHMTIRLTVMIHRVTGIVITWVIIPTLTLFSLITAPLNLTVFAFMFIYITCIFCTDIAIITISITCTTPLLPVAVITLVFYTEVPGA